MKTLQKNPRHLRGYVSYILVISTSVLMTLLMLYAYRSSIAAQAVQGEVQLYIDYSEKEETILRSIVAITPNRAMRAMQHDSNLTGADRNALRWRNIFSESITLANAHASVDDALLETIGGTGHRIIANVGDSSLNRLNQIFSPVGDDGGWVSSSVRSDLGVGYPPLLDASINSDRNRDRNFPIISESKHYSTRAQSQVGASVFDYPQFNLLQYPEINFGYARPGDPFVAKQNWWAFNVDLAGHDRGATGAARNTREMILSIYEIPTQLAISTSAFVNFGEHASGQPWQNAAIEGNVFAGRAMMADNTNVEGLTSRRGIQFGSGSTVAGRSFGENPFAPGTREVFLATEGDFFPVSLPSEGGRAAFIPINRGVDYFDRFSHSEESNTVSSTTWNQYSIGALQCAMRFDIVEAESDINPAPTAFRFSYMSGGQRVSPPLDISPSDLQDPTFPFSEFVHPGNDRRCIVVHPERLPAYLQLIGADGPSVNHSLVVNVDYPGSVNLMKPEIPSTAMDYAVVLQDCADLTAFERGFSLVTNLRLYIADDFNVTPTTPPSGYDPGGLYYPPSSLFAPEQRYGLTHDPLNVVLGGQIGSLASEDAENPVRLLDATTQSGVVLDGSRVQVNLSPIRHPAELPPITMMNWLVLLQERRSEFFTAN